MISSITGHSIYISYIVTVYLICKLCKISKFLLAVSYTHLDVYKRQVCLCLCLAFDVASTNCHLRLSVASVNTSAGENSVLAFHVTKAQPRLLLDYKMW